jgi:2-phospho-L-lactate guanylyltransferase (CobY/MobA/RfbA family)
MAPNVKINVVPNDPKITKDVLATTISKLSDATSALLNSGLNEKAILTLLADSTKLSKKSIKRIIDAINQLRADYTYL